MPKSNTPVHTITAYFLLLYLVMAAIFGSFITGLPATEPKTMLFAILAILTYPLLFMLPAIGLTAILAAFLRNRSRPRAWKSMAVYSIACLSGTASLLFLCADRFLFSLYGYHFNAFVWNLITTPGGIESLGSTVQTQFSAIFLTLLLLLVNAGSLWGLQHRSRQGGLVMIRKPVVCGMILALTLLLVVEEVGHAYARYVDDEPVLVAASIIPLHLNSSATKFFRAIGLHQPPMQERVRISHGTINYPLQPLQTKTLDKYPNIVWLTAESFRWDLLDPEITPNLWQFSAKANRFNQHYSGGNRTRMGMFSMFYGLYGSYWYGFQEQRIRPALMQVVANDNYQMAIHTSQSFSYPELRDTVFTQVPAANLQELQSGPSWQRDHQNISDINRFIREREPGRPFFSFMFFESTHAPYEFPESAVIRDSYVREVNYLQLNNLTGHIDQLHNRYINAAHHVDAEVGRVLQLLEDEGLLDETIVLFTGDHGEEFMEQGHWGHGHNKVFPEEQIRVPLLLWIPGQKPQQIDYPTSHTQLPATLLPYLGVTSSPFDYSSAPGLFAGQQPYRVVGNYNYLAVVDSEAKITFPYTSNDYFHYQVTDRLDQILPLQQQQRILVDKGQLLDEVAAESSRFILGRTVAQHDQTHPPML